MNDRSPLRRLVRVSRDFGFLVVLRVAYSKIRGKLRPALALPNAPDYADTHREVSVLLSTVEHAAATVDAVVEALAARDGGPWEVCICERPPVEPDMARALARVRGTQPWIRIVTADGSVEPATATQWVVEQATGQFVALLAPGYAPDAEPIARLLARLHHDAALDAAALVGPEGGAGSAPSRMQWSDCRLLLQRKSGYLAAFSGRWPLTAPKLAMQLDGAGARIARVAAGQGEAEH